MEDDFLTDFVAECAELGDEVAPITLYSFSAIPFGCNVISYAFPHTFISFTLTEEGKFFFKNLCTKKSPYYRGF